MTRGLAAGAVLIAALAGCADPSSPAAHDERCGAVVAPAELSGTAVVTSQEGLEAYRGQRHLDLALTLAGPDLTDLSPLRDLVQIDGRLTIRQTSSLTSLDGLACLQHLGDLRIEDAPALVDLRGLSQLRDLGGWIELTRLPALTSLEGLDGVERALAVLLTSLPRLTSVHALSGLTHLPGGLSITDADALVAVDLDGFPAEIGTLSLADNADLVDLSGLAHVAVVDALIVQQNPALRTLDDLAALTQVRDRVSIAANAALLDVDWLVQLPAWPPSVLVRSNPHVCAADLLPLLDARGEVILEVGAACPEPRDDAGPVVIEAPDGPVPSLSPYVPHYQFVVRMGPGPLGVPVTALSFGAFRDGVPANDVLIGPLSGGVVDVAATGVATIRATARDALGRTTSHDVVLAPP